MSAVLKFLGVLSVIAGVIAGIAQAHAIAEAQNVLLRGTELGRLMPEATWQLGDMLPWVVAGALSCVLWYALAQSLDNQDDIRRELADVRAQLRRQDERWAAAAPAGDTPKAGVPNFLTDRRPRDDQ